MNKVIVDFPGLRIVEIPPCRRTVSYEISSTNTEYFSLFFPRMCLVTSGSEISVFVTEAPIDPSAKYVDLFPFRINNVHADGVLCIPAACAAKYIANNGSTFNLERLTDLFFHTVFTNELTDAGDFIIPMHFGHNEIAHDLLNWSKLSANNPGLGESFDYSRFIADLATIPFGKECSLTMGRHYRLDPSNFELEHFMPMKISSIFDHPWSDADVVPEFYYDHRLSPYLDQFRLFLSLRNARRLACSLHFNPGFSMASISEENPIWEIFREIAKQGAEKGIVVWASPELDAELVARDIHGIAPILDYNVIAYD